ncbi:unnamed protein product (macronuclear) [Paramecium tetraurelia]|uniref:VPS9 domain-containing protein n=1 Tax=Paramecium tetraurelia TaxID=5888 RepID=A0BIL6_PARTE|nr:uncharacterized protein GSPATT00004755001 [Paramecium tetraurelia]CAK58383.1 unnamed protein product [Paramecium tetraurelia]|eukprot:XP_001425781.1 hypothetical protein (macronuclear) [Paramecium tetraurelia strain d4-2]
MNHNRQFQSLRSVPDVQETDETEDRIFYQMVGTTQEESHIITNSDRTAIEEWMKLQQSLKEEQYKMRQEDELKNKLLDELKHESKNYYQTYINVLVESNMNQEQKTLEESTSRLFRNAETNVKLIFEKLSNTKVCSAIFQHHNNTNRTTDIETLIRTFINSIYDNIACGSMWKQPILKLMSEIITTEVNRQEFPEFLWDREETLTQFIMKEFAKRPENVKYTKVIFKNSLIQITKVDKFLDLDKRKIAEKLRDIKKEQDKKQKDEKQSMTSSAFIVKQVPIMQNSSHKSIPQRQIPIILPIKNIEVPQQNMTVYYANLIKQYDQSKKANTKHSRRNQNQLTEFSLKVLQFGEEQRQAKFLTMERRSIPPIQESHSESPIRKLSEVYSHNSRSDQYMNNEINSVLIACIDKFKQLVNNIMENIFKNIYLIPQGIRIICKMIQITILKKFPDATEQQIQENIFSFLFNVWLIPQLVFPKQYSSFKYIREDHENTVQQIHTIIKKMIKNQKYNDDPQYNRLNQYMQDLQPSLKDYLQEILNLCPDSVSAIINDTNKIDGIQSNCVCIALDEIKVLCLLLQDMKTFKTESADLQKVINQLVILATRTLEIDKHENIFRQQSNLQTQQQIYALILNFSIPNNIVYQEQVQPLKKMKDEKLRNQRKLINALMKCLIEIQDLATSTSGNQEETSLKRVLTNFVDKYTYLDDKKTVFQIKYVLEQLKLLNKEDLQSNLRNIYQILNQEFQERSMILTEHIQQTKYQLLSAKYNIKKNYEVMRESFEQLSQEKRQKQLYDFIEKTPLTLCVTSPKTREGLFSIKAMKLRNNNNNESLDENQIWVEQQSECIHNAINLEFIKQIVGGASPNDQKKNSEFSNSHCSDIKQFIENFSSLQEVKDAVISGEDKAGVKNAYFEFIQALATFLKGKNEMKIDEIQMMDMLEKYVSKRVYDKVYPKERTYKDAGLYFRIKSLEWVNYDHLEIIKQNRVDEMWDLAVEALLNIDNCKTAVNKLEAMIQCSKIMNDVLKLTSLKEEATSADTVLPILIYILIKAAPQRLHSNLNFVSLFLDKSKTVSQQGYCLTQLQLAIQWLEEVDHKLLKMDQLNFLETITKAEIRYGIHYLKRRNRSERISMPLNKIQALIN